MQLRRAHFLTSALTTYHGACLMSVCANIVSLAREYSIHRERDSTSIGLSFQFRVGSFMQNPLCGGVPALVVIVGSGSSCLAVPDSLL